MKFSVTIDSVPHLIEVTVSDGGISATLNGEPRPLDVVRVPDGVNLRLGGHIYDVVIAKSTDTLTSLSVRDQRVFARVVDESQVLRRRSRSAPPAAREVRAPMPGRIVRVCVAAGDEVALNEPLVVIEAMKMENELRAVGSGVIETVDVAEGDSVERDALLLTFQ